MTEPTAGQREALDIAAAMIDAGIPVFAAPPCQGKQCTRKGHDTGKIEYDLPAKWQLTVPSKVWLKRWEPGWALAAVGGHAADFLDEDPRHGGEMSIEALIGAGHMPRVFGVQETPSGGRHHVISPLHERETNGFMPGLDYQGGLPDGKGRAFVWIAPTVKRSKDPATLGQVRAYRWLQPPDLDYLAEFEGSDDTIEPLRDRILARKARAEGNPERADREQEERRAFTEAEAQRFCEITLNRLAAAQRGDIENAANSAAVQLSHFVPEFWTEAFAFDVLHRVLATTAYNPDGPSDWTAEKFHDVIAGVEGRAPGDWIAVRKPEKVDEVLPEVDAVDRLLAEMLHPSEVVKRPAPKHLIKGLLNLDSESWIIGAPGSKKSFVALCMAGHVARGLPWQGMKVTQGRVVMIVAEGAGGLGPRLKAWESRYGEMGDDVFILPRPVQAANLDAWAVLREVCRRIAPALVVLDTQARITVGLEENSAKEMGVYVEAVRSIREATGACVLSVHHTGRQGGDARGSSAIDGAQHSELKVKSEGLRAELISEKQKDMELAAALPLVFEVVTVGQGEDGEPITSLVLAGDAFSRAAGQESAREVPEDWEILHPGVQAQIIRVLRDQGLAAGLTKAEAKKDVADRWYAGVAGRDRGLRSSTYHTAWSTLVTKQLIVNVGGARWALDEVALEAESLPDR